MASAPIDALPATRARGERPLYTTAALAGALVMFAGFAPSYYLKSLVGTPELTTLKHFHGVVMTAWFVLFFVQARLVATGRTATHRQLGLAGIFLAAVVVATGMALAIASVRTGVSPVPGIPPLVFLVLPVGEMVSFVGLFSAAIALRKRGAWHKRLMLLASLAMLTPAFARFPTDAIGLKATEKLTAVCPQVKVLTLSRHADDGYLRELLAAGACAYVLKQSAPSELIHAIRAVAAGGKYIDPKLAAKVMAPYGSRSGSVRGEAKGNLSDRESEVLRLIALGYSNKEIAANLSLSVKTIEVHKANAMRKLNITSRIDLVRYAIFQGWLQDH